ncbi:MAG TPA: GGDEF domain-containing protein [Ramlibacter sp.]|nr:GGDEF domain-containing protein [Ramlibacter sp.]
MSQTSSITAPNRLGPSSRPGPASRQAPPSQQAETPALAPLQSRRETMAFSVRLLEPWISWSIAMYTGLVALLLHPQAPWLWLFAAYAALVGKWAEQVPARQQLQLFLRALAMLAAGFVMHSQAAPSLGERADLLFFWLFMPTFCYAFLLRRGWAWGVLGLALFALTLSWLQARSFETWTTFAAEAGFLALFTPLVAMRFGSAMHSVELALEQGLRDRSTRLYNMSGLLHHGDALAEACQRRKQPMTLVLLDCPDLLKVDQEHGRSVARKAIGAWVRSVQRIAGERGLAARTGPTEFAVLMPWQARDKVLRGMERELGEEPSLDLVLGSAEITLTPAFRIGMLDEKVSTVEDLHEHLSNQLKGGFWDPPLKQPEPEPVAIDKEALLEDREFVADPSGFPATNVQWDAAQSEAAPLAAT